ncbi:MAG TPA: hypothetical protein VFI31_21465 [Pirellulales bacterium]|nr:hypothetical protein [Pirellulales bacterium]
MASRFACLLLACGFLLPPAKAFAAEQWLTKKYDLRELQELTSQSVDALVAEVKRDVFPEAWDCVGGEGTIKIISGTAKISVRQTATAHEEIADWIEQKLRLAERQARKEKLARRSASIVERQRRPPVSTGELTNTELTAHLDVPLADGRNVVFGIVTQLAWKCLQAEVGGPVELAGDPELAQKLNGSDPSAARLDPVCYVAVAGKGSAAIERLRRSLAERFPDKVAAAIALPDDSEVLLYSYLFRRLPFSQWFERLEKPLTFRTSAGVERVDSFGIADFSGSYAPHDKLRKQVTILDYRSDDDFVLQLHADGHDDEIVLAKVARQKTLRRTIAAVEARIARKPSDPPRSRLVEHESLAVPIIDINVLHRTSDLRDREILNAGWRGARIGWQATRIQFRLDESGAVVEMEEELEGLTVSPPPPRHFVFDRPFLIYLRMPDTGVPYFAAWIENAEVLERRQ